MAAVKLGGGCDVSSVRLKAATCSQKKLGNSSLFGLEVGGSSQLNRGLKLATPNKRARSIGISMNRSDKFSSQPGNEDTTDQEPMLFTEQVLKLSKCLEKNYTSTVEVASIWNAISLRAAGKKDYNYASEANFISRSFHDQAVLIRAKANELKLFVEKHTYHSKVVTTRAQEVREKRKDVAQDGGPLKLIRWWALNRATLGATTHSSGVSKNLVDQFCQAPVEFTIMHSLAQIEETMRTTNLVAPDLLNCLKDKHEEFVSDANSWYELSLTVARKENYSYARQAYFIFQSFYYVALLLKAEQNGVTMLQLKQRNQSEAAMTRMLEIAEVQVNEDENVSQVGGSLNLIEGLKLATPNTTQESISSTEQAIKLHNCLEKNYRSTVEFASVWNEIALRAATSKEDYSYACIANFISREYYDEAVLIKAKADGLKIFLENEIDQAEAATSMMLEMSGVEEKAHENVAQDGGPLKLIRGLHPSGTRMNVFSHFCQAAIEDVIKHSIIQMEESKSTTDVAASELGDCLQLNYKKYVKIASFWHSVSLIAARTEDYSYARKAYFVSQSFYDAALLAKAEADALEHFVFNHGIQSKAVISLLQEIFAIQVSEDKNASQG